MSIKSCPVCLGEFESADARKLYCARACGDVARKKNLPCSSCGVLMWRSRTTSDTPKCSDCRRRDRCGSTNGYRKGCRCADCTAAHAAVHRERYATRKAQGRPVTGAMVERNCERCGGGFTAKRRNAAAGGARFCSLDCANLALNGRARRDEPRDRFRISDAAREEIYARDLWVCQICFEPTEPLSAHGSSWYPSLDHVVPRSQGGGDSPSNLRCAHRWCNSVLSDGTYYKESDLVG